MHKSHILVSSNMYLDVIGVINLTCVTPSLLNTGRLRDEVREAINRDSRIAETWKRINSLET